MWGIVDEGQSTIDSLGKPLKHKSSELQACGEAVYIDDIPKRENELYLAFVLSTRAHAKLLKVDPSEALKESGVLDFISRKDIPAERNHFHTVINRDEVLFAEDEVFCVGQIIGAVIGTTQVILLFILYKYKKLSLKFKQ